MAHPVRLTDKVSSLNDEEELRKRGYILGITLGEGSYAKVKRAYSEKLNKKVALKIINKKKAPKDFQQKFLPRELEILTTLNHPNVVQLYDIMHFNHKVYIAMEVAGHGDLLEYIKLRGAIQEDRARRFFHQLVSAVQYLHSIHVIHRDLKCENILLDTQNNIKVSDFGFARILMEDDVSRTFCGSAAYAAPEILQGIPYSGMAYDIWSMGVILYIMVCGSMPYDDSNIRKMIKYQTQREVGFSKSRNVSDLCKNLIRRLLEAVVQKRAQVPEILQHPWMTLHVERNQPTAPSALRPETAPAAAVAQNIQGRIVPDSRAPQTPGTEPYQRPQNPEPPSVNQNATVNRVEEARPQPNPENATNRAGDSRQPQTEGVSDDVRRMTIS